VNPIGTAPSAHLKDIDFAGKTGSAQTISNQALAKLGGNKARFRDNGWFVGVTPRRNPEIVVAVLVEQGEHGYLAARVASQVIKAYVEKKRKREAQTNVAKAPEDAVPQSATTPGGTAASGTAVNPVDVSGVWKSGEQPDGQLQGGTFKVKPDEKPKPSASAAPGMTAPPAQAGATGAAKPPAAAGATAGESSRPAQKKAPPPAQTGPGTATNIEPKPASTEQQR
jgi:penicillin-binding protein 2